MSDNLSLDIERAITLISPDLMVRHGVFKGMKYPRRKSVGSTFVPKLLGSYEREIQSVLEIICATEYTEIIDVGCAEGYYAVGLAMRIPTAKVYAYDTCEEAIRLCQEMARENNVSERIITGSFCNASTLISVPITRRALVLSDCEGYEKELFNKKIAPSLARHELLIETHDFIDIEISTYIRKIFEPTHDIQVIQSIDDIKKALQYDYDELRPFDLADRKTLLAECRPAIMEWFYMTPRRSP